jgi:hypothetical protein
MNKFLRSGFNGDTGLNSKTSAAAFKVAAFAIVLLVAGCFCVGSAFGQTQTIASGATKNASTITGGAGVTITIAAGGTLNMDVSNNFASIITTGAGTSSITGSGILTTGAITLNPGHRNFYFDN